MSLLFRQYLLPAAMLSLLLFLTSLWLPQGSVQSCESSWLPCLSISLVANKEDSNTNVGRDVTTNSNDVITDEALVIGQCPGQSFQVSRLLFYLNSTMTSGSDVLLEPYLLCWEELIKFMEALGPLVGFFTNKVQEKITLIRQLSKEDAGKHLISPASPHITHNAQHHAYLSVRSMLEAELQSGVVSFDKQTPSGSRTLLRLHRSLLWLQLLLEKVGVTHDGRSLGELCAEAYEEALAPHHPWFLQQAARLVFRGMPERKALLHIVCVNTQEEAEPVIHTIVMAIREVRRRTQTELEQRNMLNLP